MKKNILKRLLSLALALVLVVGLLPRFAVEANAATATYKNFGISVNISEVPCPICKEEGQKDFSWDCERATIKNVTLSGKTLTIVVECSTRRHSRGVGHVYTGTVTRTSSNCRCTTNHKHTDVGRTDNWK